MSDELRDELILTIYFTPTPAGAFPRSQWPFPVSVTELADAILPIIARECAAAKAEALREAIDDVLVSDWWVADLVRQDFDNVAPDVRNWLSARADRAAGTETGKSNE